MVSLSVFLLVVFTSGVLSEDSLLTPCEIHDTQCLSKTTQEFLEKTSKGIPEYGIKTIEPLHIPFLEYVLIEKPSLTMRLRNITVMGLKNQQFSGFEMNTDTKSVTLQTKVEMDVTSDLEVDLGNGKTYTGAYSIKGPVLGTAKYGYDFKVDDKGIEHFEVGPETITCQALGEPKVTLSPELEKGFNDDEDASEIKKIFTSKAMELRDKEICSIVKEAYVSVVHNIRASAKILPKNAFLKGV